MNMGQEAWYTAVEQGKECYNKGKEAVGDVGRSAKEFAKQAQDVTKRGSNDETEAYLRIHIIDGSWNASVYRRGSTGPGKPPSHQIR